MSGPVMLPVLCECPASFHGVSLAVALVAGHELLIIQGVLITAAVAQQAEDAVEAQAHELRSLSLESQMVGSFQ